MNIFRDYKNYNYFDHNIASAISFFLHLASEHKFPCSLVSCTRSKDEYTLVFTCIDLPHLLILESLSNRFERMSIDVKCHDVTICVSWSISELPF